MKGSVDKNVYRVLMRRLSDLRTKRTARATGCAALRRLRLDTARAAASAAVCRA